MTMNTWTVFTLLAVAGCTMAQSAAPCSPKDSGPFLGTYPTLAMDMNEATAADLSARPEMYRAELRLNGDTGSPGPSGIELEVMPDFRFMNPEDVFRFTTMGGVNYVQMYKPLDRDGPTPAVDDDTNVFSFTLKCSPRVNMSDVKYFDTKIFVLDVNDNDPMFVNLTSPLVLNELTPPGPVVLTAKAVDLDLLSNLTYTLQSRQDLADDMSSHFVLDAETGDLRVKDALDYETMSEGTLVISVSDDGSPARTATATVQVRVEDGDDQGPVYVYPGCWTFRARCAWPKYTTSTTITQGQAISVLPVPNKVHAEVAIKAKDLDNAGNPIVFSIASTIPPGNDHMFTISTTRTGSGHYAATITPTLSTTVRHGFEIFLQAEEQSEHKRFEVAMIFFEDPNYVCASGTSSAGQGTQKPAPEEHTGQGQTAQGQTGQAETSNDNSSSEKYTEPIIALIVVVAILAAFVLCLGLAFFCLVRKATPASGTDVALTRM